MSIPEQRFARSFFHVLGWGLVLGLLWWPVDQAAALTGNSELRRLNLFGSAAAAIAIACLSRLLPQAWARALLVVGVLGALSLRVLHLGLVKFSGAGFTLEFFLHLEWQSVWLALAQYPGLAALLLILIVVLATLLGRLTGGARSMPRIPALSALLVASLVALFSRGAFPEYKLLRAWQSWNSPLAAELSTESLQRWREADWLSTEIPHKRFLQAYTPGRPLNLVLVYLESVGAPLIHHPRWPGLMPRLAELQRTHALLPSLHASSFITVEGLINSQCGSLLPFHRDSDTYASGERVFEGLTCLGDVLRKAGYRQSYLGGAGMGFGGKGAFLSAHGYDRLLGSEHWLSLGLSPRPGTWGLADPDLFAQAELEIERLRELGQPFNLTLLTIGTHLPGYRYEECSAYALADPVPESQRDFIDALHCTDHLLGGFVDRLQARGVLEDTLLVITADHHVFPNPDMRALFGEAVEDRRLPLLALGPVAARPDPDVQGAGFDLAPTLLDLLGVRHNARFMLGRSLLTARTAERSYLPNRYSAVLNGTPAPPAHECKPPSEALSLPLDACSHQEMLQLLAAAVGQLSEPAAQLACESASATGVRVEFGSDPVLQLWLAGEPQLDRFTWNSRPLQRTQGGLYRLSFDRMGRLAERQFVPDDISLEERQAMAGAASAMDSGGLSLLAWLPKRYVEPQMAAHEAAPETRFTDELSQLLPRFQPEFPGAWWLAHGTGIAAVEIGASADSSLALWLDPSLCEAVLSAP